MNENLPRLITRQTLGRLFDRDPRTVSKLVRPVAILVSGEKETPLFDAGIFAALSVNLGKHPNESKVEL